MASTSQETRDFDANSVSSSVSSNKNAEIIAAAFAEPSNHSSRGLMENGFYGSGVDDADKDSLSTVSSDTLEEMADKSKTASDISEVSCADLDNDEEDDDLISVSSGEESEELDGSSAHQEPHQDSSLKKDETIQDATGKFDDDETDNDQTDNDETDHEETDHEEDNGETQVPAEIEETTAPSQTTIKKEVRNALFYLTIFTRSFLILVIYLIELRSARRDDRERGLGRHQQRHHPNHKREAAQNDRALGQSDEKLFEETRRTRARGCQIANRESKTWQASAICRQAQVESPRR